MTQKAHKTSSNGGDSRQNRIILGRTICLMVLFGVAAFIPLLGEMGGRILSKSRLFSLGKRGILYH